MATPNPFKTTPLKCIVNNAEVASPHYRELKSSGFNYKTLSKMTGQQLSEAIPSLSLGDSYAIIVEAKEYVNKKPPARISMSPTPPYTNAGSMDSQFMEKIQEMNQKFLEQMEKRFMSSTGAKENIPQVPKDIEKEIGSLLVSVEQRGLETLSTNTIIKLHRLGGFYKRLGGNDLKTDHVDLIITNFVRWAQNNRDKLQSSTLRSRLGALKSLLQKQYRYELASEITKKLLNLSILTYVREELKLLQHGTQDSSPAFTTADVIHHLGCILTKCDHTLPDKYVLQQTRLIAGYQSGRRTSEITFYAAGSIEYEMELLSSGNYDRIVKITRCFAKNHGVVKDIDSFSENNNDGFSNNIIGWLLLLAQRIGMIKSAYLVYTGKEKFQIDAGKWESANDLYTKMQLAEKQMKARFIPKTFGLEESSDDRFKSLINEVCELDKIERAKGIWKYPLFLKYSNKGGHFLSERLNTEGGRTLHEHGKFLGYIPSLKHNFGGTNARSGAANDVGRSQLGGFNSADVQATIQGHSREIRTERYVDANQVRATLTNNILQSGISEEIVNKRIAEKNKKHRPAYKVEGFFQKWHPIYTNIFPTEKILEDHGTCQPSATSQHPSGLHQCYEVSCNETFYFFGDLLQHINELHSKGSFCCPCKVDKNGIPIPIISYMKYRAHVAFTQCIHSDTHPMRECLNTYRRIMVATNKVNQVIAEATNNNDNENNDGQSQNVSNRVFHFWCPYNECEYSHLKKDKVVTHFKKKHHLSKDEYNKLVNEYKDGKVPPKKEDSEFVCTLCGRDTGNQISFQRHMKYNHASNSADKRKAAPAKIPPAKKECCTERDRARWTSETEQQRQVRREAINKRARARRASETEQQRQVRREAINKQDRARLASKTEQQRRLRREAINKRNRLSRLHETEAEAALRRERTRRDYQKKRVSLSASSVGKTKKQPAKKPPAKKTNTAKTQAIYIESEAEDFMAGSEIESECDMDKKPPAKKMAGSESESECDMDKKPPAKKTNTGKWKTIYIESEEEDVMNGSDSSLLNGSDSSLLTQDMSQTQLYEV